ncbi:MAG: hypothetical protein LBP40_00975 [Campylobacteraceae bacterium]|nr:hypothetical protein [Campylobacteraceae bacterium]
MREIKSFHPKRYLRGKQKSKNSLHNSPMNDATSVVIVMNDKEKYMNDR